MKTGPCIMNKTICSALWLLLLPMLLTGCIRDDIVACPPLSLRVGIEDFNYSNAASFQQETLRPTDGPLSDYVSTLSWCITDVATGRIVAEHAAYEAPADRQREDIVLPDSLPFGRYAVSVWGSMPQGLEFPEFADLGDSKEDPYLVHDTLVYDATHADHTLLLRRIKSKLDIQVEGLPEQWDASSSSKQETGLYEECDNRFTYEGEMLMGNRTRFSNRHNVLTATVLPPSVGYNQTRVTIHIYDENGQVIPQLDPQPITTTLYRNTITAIRYVYVVEKQGYDVYVRINDDWEVITNMDIE